MGARGPPTRGPSTAQGAGWLETHLCLLWRWGLLPSPLLPLGRKSPRQVHHLSLTVGDPWTCRSHHPNSGFSHTRRRCCFGAKNSSTSSPAPQNFASGILSLLTSLACGGVGVCRSWRWHPQILLGWVSPGGWAECRGMQREQIQATGGGCGVARWCQLLLSRFWVGGALR